MKRDLLVGVDLGTSATKAALYKPDGTLIAQSHREVPIHHRAAGVVEQENSDFYLTAAQTVRECIEASGVEPRSIAAIAFDSQMAGLGSVDSQYRPATRFDSWLDMRCQPYIVEMDRQAGQRITELTGCPPTCDAGPKMLWWMHERPQEYARVAKFVMPAAFVAGSMAELRADQAFIDCTFIHFSGFSDTKALRWSDELCNRFGLDKDKLPQIVEPWKVIGEVRPAASRDFGLAEGTIIAAGCGDTAANALGAGVVRPGTLFDSAGTAAVLAACTDTFVADLKHRALLCMRSVIPGIYHPLAYIAGGGLALRWFRDQFYEHLRDFAGKDESDLYDEMIAQAAEIEPGAAGLFFSPHLGGRICPSAPEMRGAWVGISWGHTQAHFLRALLESIAFEYAYYLMILLDQIPALKILEARAVGGGARSTVWNRIKADVLGVPYQRLAGSEFGTWGSALIAGRAAGIFPDLAAQALKTSKPEARALTPDPHVHNIYVPLARKYIQLEKDLHGHFGKRLN
jgi:xylulokinase